VILGRKRQKKNSGNSNCKRISCFVLHGPHGLAFVKTSDDDDLLREQIKDVCQTLLSEN
jgi:hypothetical protein